MKRTTLTSPVRSVTDEVMIQKMRSIVQLFGKGFWKGDLSEMRDDRPRPRPLRKNLAH